MLAGQKNWYPLVQVRVIAQSLLPRLCMVITYCCAGRQGQGARVSAEPRRELPPHAPAPELGSEGALGEVDRHMDV